MSWYVMQCRSGNGQEMIHSLKQHLSKAILEDAFVFRNERLWRTPGGIWKLIEKEMFPGYVFLQSSNQDALLEELEEYRKIVRVMEEPGYLISVYKEEEESLRWLCDDRHFLRLSYGYRENGVDYILEGPLKGMEDCILKADWHRRFAQIEVSMAGKKQIVWAGLGLPRERKAS